MPCSDHSNSLKFHCSHFVGPHIPRPTYTFALIRYLQYTFLYIIMCVAWPKNAFRNYLAWIWVWVLQKEMGFRFPRVSARLLDDGRTRKCCSNIQHKFLAGYTKRTRPPLKCVRFMCTKYLRHVLDILKGSNAKYCSLKFDGRFNVDTRYTWIHAQHTHTHTPNRTQPMHEYLFSHYFFVCFASIYGRPKRKPTWKAEKNNIK